MSEPMEKMEISPRELQLASLEMARYFRDFCKEHNLICYFCGRNGNRCHQT